MSSKFEKYATVERIQNIYDQYLEDGVIETFVVFVKRQRYLRIKTNRWSEDTKWSRLATLIYESLLRMHRIGVTDSKKRLRAFVYMAIAYYQLTLESEDAEQVIRTVIATINPNEEEHDHHFDLIKAYCSLLKPERHYEILPGNMDDL